MKGRKMKNKKTKSKLKHSTERAPALIRFKIIFLLMLFLVEDGIKTVNTSIGRWMFKR